MTNKSKNASLRFKKAFTVFSLTGLFGLSNLSLANSLEESIRVAIKNHPEVQAQIKEHATVRDEEQKAYSRYLPQILLSAGIGPENSENNTTRTVAGGGSETLKRREAQVLVTQNLFDGFKMQSERAREQSRLDAADYQLIEVAEDVAIRVVNAYIAVVESNQVVKNSKENLLSHQRIYDQIQMRVKSGADNKANISQIRARLALARSNLETALNNLYDAESQYYELVGVNPPELTNMPYFDYDLPQNKGEAIDLALANHPSVLSGRHQVKAQEMNVEAVEGDYYPNFFIESGASWNNNLDGSAGRNDDAYIMLKMEYNLFQGGFTDASQRQAMSQYEKSQYELDAQLREVRKNSEVAWNAYKSSDNRVAYLKDYVESTQETQKAYEQQFRIGQRSLLDVLDSENELLRAKNQYVQAQSELTLSKYQVLRALGRLLNSLEVKAPEAEQLPPGKKFS
ncbi:TolC family outer membrane protein [Litoribrevibacter albus]|uniref:Channel protein TolC n=1 Tax=Litoribrevibacter albus TaxID=1473156 RepID=A0AA37W724_9GAMM|nr:TolC family outer membrane protein [Litoribrevibacter albus]GLQ30674.1 channel protein TolC [Litoribrevibacter albus]